MIEFINSCGKNLVKSAIAFMIEVYFGTERSLTQATRLLQPVVCQEIYQ
jgi:hypothetical protein